MDQQQQIHPIFDDIAHGDLGAVQQRVLADGAVLEERARAEFTPLMWAIIKKKPAITLWLISHREQHDVDALDILGSTALHWASGFGPLEVVQALVRAGANPAAIGITGVTPLMIASHEGQSDIVAFLFRLPPVTASIDVISRYHETALSVASRHGHQPIVQLLLDAGADPTIPAGHYSPLNRALSNNHHAIAALLRHAIDEADRARALHKARCLVSAGAAVPACLQGRVEQGQALPQLGFVRRGRLRNEKLQVTAAFAVGMAGGEKDTGLCDELYVELLEYMLPLWADKGPAGGYEEMRKRGR